MKQLDKYAQVGISQTIQVNWEEFMEYKHSIIDPMPTILAKSDRSLGVDIYQAHGYLLDAHIVQVGNDQIWGKTIVLATGEHPSRLNIPGKDLLHDSRDFLSMQHAPHHITFIGAGYISLEFASMMREMGAEVDIVQHSDHVLRGLYGKYVQKLVAKLQKEGVTFYFGETISKVLPNSYTYTVQCKSGLEFETNYIVDATGRVPNVNNLGLEKVGINFSEQGIQVDNHLRTNVQNIYASGDVIDKAIDKLTPTATFECNYITEDILNPDNPPIQYPAIPRVVYSLPRIAQVGIKIDDAKNDVRFSTVVIPFGKAKEFETKRDLDAEATFVLNQEKQIVGAAVYGDSAAELINFLTLIVNQKMTPKDIKNLIFAFPTVSHSITSSLSDLA